MLLYYYLLYYLSKILIEMEVLKIVLSRRKHFERKALPFGTRVESHILGSYFQITLPEIIGQPL